MNEWWWWMMCCVDDDYNDMIIMNKWYDKWINEYMILRIIWWIMNDEWWIINDDVMNK